MKTKKELHGESGTAQYLVWKAMRNRCHNPKDKRYLRYGGRGISVCERWMNSYSNFLEDMGVRPDGMTLERKDTNGNYCPENCRWATQKEQQNNRSNNWVLTNNGESMNLIQWAEKTGISSDLIRIRIRKLGWDISRALTQPTRGKNV